MIFLTGLMGPVGQLGAVGWQHRGMLSEVLRDPHEANFLGQVVSFGASIFEPSQLSGKSIPDP